MNKNVKDNKLELLAPAGSERSFFAAVEAGADAVYCGLDKFNARHRAPNISFDDLGGILALAHRRGCRVFLTLNIMMVESDIPVLVGVLNRLVNTSRWSLRAFSPIRFRSVLTACSLFA